MAFKTDDRVKETSTTVGTIDFVLAGAVTGFITFNAGVGTTNTTYYTIVGEDVPAEWEVGVGTVTNATTLQRDTVLDNSAGTTAKIVFVSLPSEKALMKDTSGNIVFGDASDPGLATKGFATAMAIAL